MLNSRNHSKSGVKLLIDHMMYTNLLALSPKDYCLIPGNGVIKLVVIGPKITKTKLITLSPKDYQLIPGCSIIKLVANISYNQKSTK